ncbi:MAG TPA: MmgE/PrpD family protein [Eoetvoesiella sp.]
MDVAKQLSSGPAIIDVPGPVLISRQLADFTAALDLSDVPGAVITRAKYLMLDAIGCAFAARKEEFAKRIATSVAKLSGDGARGVVGMPYRLPLRDAAVVNGMLMHGLDYDDTHAAGVAHLTVSNLPAALASAAHVGASGAQLLTAYIAGMEAGARLASVVKGGFHQIGFHPTGLIGTFACALVSGRLLNLSSARLVGAQGIALSLASGNLQFIEDGSWTKRLHPGWAASSGITAAFLAADDIPAPLAAYEGRFGLFCSHLPPAELALCDFSIATADLGSVWEIDNVAIKPFPACHFVHGCVDAAIALHRTGVDVGRIKSIRALIPAGVIKSVAEPEAAKRRPKSDYDAKFSIHYGVASGLLRGRLGLAELLPTALIEPKILQLMDKVNYEADPATTFPRHYTGEVVVTLDDGRILSHRVAVNRGNPDQPLSNADIEAKYFDNSTLNFSHEVAQQVRDLVLDLESLPRAVQLETALAATTTA